jgi:Asp-tRNA(Asn)/Glu-tRNA(Gln) amidotransferase A subunit family amidase
MADRARPSESLVASRSLAYDHVVARSPRLSGSALKNLARFARTRIGGIALQRILRSDLGVDRLEALPDELRSDVPLDTNPHPGRPPRQHESQNLSWPASGWAPSSTSLTAAYREGRLSPRDVVTQALAEARRLADLTPSVGPILDYADEAALAEADASEKRWRSGNPLGPLDGVPWAVKEQSAVRGLPRKGGTSFLDGSGQAADATAVARIRRAGAITIGTTPMTEFGMTPNGANSKRVMPRNPHGTDRIAGGSSTGTGVAIATGLVPFGLGADGGGSIRIPASLNGVFGIKPTWGRVSRFGDISGGSVAHLGPLAGSTIDLAHALEAMSGHDHDDPQTFAAPERTPGSFVSALSRGVRGLTIGVVQSEWLDAADPVQRAGRAALAALEKEGAVLVDIELQLAKYASAIGVVIIACEARAALRKEWREHADDMGDDLQISFAALDAFTAVEYIDTCRLRTGLRREMARAFQDVDLLAIPSTVAPAAKISDGDMRSGFVDTKVLDGLCRFMFLGNLTGLPAASAPVGCDALGLPVGLQLVGDAWDEATVLAATAHLERIGVAVPRRPRVTANIRA